MGITKEKIDEVLLKERERKLFINRIPKNIKEEFIKFAEEEFCGDYGLCLKYVWDNFKIWKIFFENIDLKLDVIIEMIQNKQETEPKNMVKTLSGKILKKGGKKNE